MTLSEIYDQAADLIERDGWVRGGGGWYTPRHVGGWCIEGALGKAVGIFNTVPSSVDMIADANPDFYATEAYIQLSMALGGRLAYSFNDSAFSSVQVIKFLRDLANKHRVMTVDQIAQDAIEKFEASLKGATAALVKMGEAKPVTNLGFFKPTIPIAESMTMWAEIHITPHLDKMDETKTLVSVN